MNVVIYNYPYDAPDDYIKDVLDHYGTIQGVRHQHWTNLPEISTGTRLVRINLKKSIPRFVMFHTYRCKVWYRGQPLHCDICKEGSHIAFNCPYKGKCLACKQPGHLARSCPSVCYRCKGGHASDSRPARRRWEYVSRDVEEVPSAAAADAAGVDSENLALAEAASVAEVVVRTGLCQSASQSSQVTDVPEVIVVEEGVATPPVPRQVLSDERFNQLDELDSQSSGGVFADSSQIGNTSQSILVNCGPGGASSGGELSAVNQIIQAIGANVNSNSNVISKENASKVKNAGNNNDMSNGNKSNVSNAGNCNVNESEANLNMENSNDNSNSSYCYSAVPLDGTPPGPPSFALPAPVDSVMATWDLRKRTISDVSSDDAAGSLSSSAPPSPCTPRKQSVGRESVAIPSDSIGSFSSPPSPSTPEGRGKNKKGAKKISVSHIPASIARVARMASFARK